ncbi:MAG: hypothetical protein ACJAS3_001190 [Roseivirga sp.]|jgi:hypothetical protein
MDIRKQLGADHFKAYAELIVDYTDNRQERFDILMNLFLNNEYQLAQRAARVVGDMARRHYVLVIPHLRPMIINLIFAMQSNEIQSGFCR